MCRDVDASASSYFCDNDENYKHMLFGMVQITFLLILLTQFCIFHKWEKRKFVASVSTSLISRHLVSHKFLNVIRCYKVELSILRKFLRIFRKFWKIKILWKTRINLQIIFKKFCEFPAKIRCRRQLIPPKRQKSFRKFSRKIFD